MAIQPSPLAENQDVWEVYDLFRTQRMATFGGMGALDLGKVVSLAKDFDYELDELDIRKLNYISYLLIKYEQEDSKKEG